MNAKIEDPTIANLEIVNQKARIWKIKIGDSNIKRKNSRPEDWDPQYNYRIHK